MIGFATSAVRDAVNSDAGPRPRPRADRRAHRRALRRGRGPADVPRRTPLVRLVRRPAGGLRHRRRLARDRRRCRRGAGRRVVAAARRGPAGPHLLPRRPPERRRASARSAARSAPRSPATPATCSAPARPTARPRRPRRSAPWRGSAARRRPATARWCRGRCRWPSCASGSPSWWRCRPTSSRRCRASRRAAGHQIVPGALVAEGCMDIFDLDRARDLPVGAARGRDPRAARPDLACWATSA